MIQSLYFDDFQIGDEFRSAGRTITETDLVLFGGLTGDITSLHLDAEYSAQTQFGQRIAHGALIFSLSVGLMTQTVRMHDSIIAYYGIDKLRFTKPTFIGDTIHLTKRVVALDAKDTARGVITFEAEVKNQRGEVVQVYTDKVAVKRRS
ncbi:MAG: MaoC family dehydratase N-terminal domain-containing protein [Bryobacteraceae bacterium]|nr:MaoC family dehydratase N-terminal domain-containing protein [Bryobacteraceae bacterium]